MYQQIRFKANYTNYCAHREIYDETFISVEFMTALRIFNHKKVPGVDGFTADIYDKVTSRDPELILEIINESYQLSYFP